MSSHLARCLAVARSRRGNHCNGADTFPPTVGAGGARLVLTLLKEMKRRNLETGVAALCVGGGQGAALVLERK